MSLSDRLRQAGALGRRTAIKTGDRFQFEGGLNTEDAPMLVAPGHVLGGKNFEPGIRGGYTSMDGMERFDGRLSPTDTTFRALTFSAAGAGIGVSGDLLKQYSGLTLVASGTIAYVRYTDDPTNSEGYVALYSVTGTFVEGDGLWLAASTGADPNDADLDEVSIESEAPSEALRIEFEAAKAEYLRSLIEAVPGSGNVLGIHQYDANTYAFRNNVGGTAADMWKATTAGWTQIDLGFKLRFDQGVEEIIDGQTIVGATSGATCVAKRVVSDDGTWGTDASGYICSNGAVPVFQADEDLKVGLVVVARYKSIATQTLAPDGTYFFRNKNFTGDASKYRMYWVNGVNKGMEFDGDVFVLADTGMDPDIPHNLFIHNNHWFLVFNGGSIQNSGTAKPLEWNPIVGADERSVGEEVTGCQEEVDRVTLIATRQQKWSLTGDVVENFQLRLYTQETGAIKNTMARVGQTIFLDDIGFTTTKASSVYGNFQSASISDKIRKLLARTLKYTTPVGAQINRNKNLYRLFFEDGTALVLASRTGNKFSGWMPIVLPVAVSCVSSGELTEGTIYAERTFVGSPDGYVYETDKGSSFDGENIEAFIRMSYHHSGSPEFFKRYRRAQIDVEVQGNVTLLGTVDFDYGLREGQAGEDLDFSGGGGFWDVANWNEFLWDSAALNQIIIKIEGTGFNVGFFFYKNSNTDAACTLFGASFQSSPRRLNRGTQGG